jgi:hypothetical protein
VTTLREIVAAQTVAAEELPLVHTTRCEILTHIVASDELRSVTECEVFHEHLLYFFYGRPAYRYTVGSEPSGTLDPCPVCFVFKPHTIGSAVKRVFACDSGGIHKGYFKDHLFPPDRDAMQLETNIESPGKLVTLVFGDNSRYYAGEAKPTCPTAFAPGTAAARFYDLLTDSRPGKGDDRRSAIELQMDSPVALDHHLLYVILPKEKLNEPGTREVILQRWQTDPIGYSFTKFRPPHEYRTLIGSILEERYKEAGRL